MPANKNGRGSHPLHVFQDSLVIKPFSPTKRFFISACRSTAVIVFWGLLTLIAGRILLPAVFKQQRQTAPLTARIGGENGTEAAVVLSPAGQAALEAISSCDLGTEQQCPFAALSNAQFLTGEVHAQTQRVSDIQSNIENIQKSVESLRADSSADHSKVCSYPASRHEGRSRPLIWGSEAPQWKLRPHSYAHNSNFKSAFCCFQAIAQLESVETALRAELTGSVSELTQRVSALETWKADMAPTLDASIAQLQESLAQVEASAASKEALQSLQSAVEGASSGLLSAQQELQALQDKNTELEQAISKAQRAASSAQETADAASSAASQAATQLQAVEITAAADLAAAEAAAAATPSDEDIAAAVKTAAERATAEAAVPAVRDAVAAATADIHSSVASVLEAALGAPDLKEKINTAVHKAALEHAAALASGEASEEGSVRAALQQAVQEHLTAALSDDAVVTALQEHVASAQNTQVDASVDAIKASIAEHVKNAQETAVASALAGVDDEVAKQVAEKVAAAQADALATALDADTVDSLVTSAVASAVQSKVDAAATIAAASLNDAKDSSLLQLQGAADELILKLRAEKDALQAVQNTPRAPVQAEVDFSQWAAVPKAPGAAVALQYPANVASAAQGAQVQLGEDATTGTDMLARLTGLVEECSELHPVPPSGAATPIQSMLMSKAQGQAPTGNSAVAASGTAAKMAACAEAHQALTAYGTEGSKNNRNPKWVLHASRPQPGQAWLVEKQAAKITLLLPHASSLARIGVLAPTAFQRGGSPAPDCRPASISAVCAEDGQVPVMLLSETDLEWNAEQDEAGEAFVGVDGAPACGRVLVTVKSSGRQVCTHRLVLQQ